LAAQALRKKWGRRGTQIHLEKDSCDHQLKSENCFKTGKRCWRKRKSPQKKTGEFFFRKKKLLGGDIRILGMAHGQRSKTKIKF